MLDVLIVGAGTAGATAAWRLAERGLSVRCVDARALDRAGAHWVNGVHAEALEQLDVPRPPPPHAHVGPTMHMVAGWGPERVTVRGTGLLELDMRWLVAHVQQRARQAGAQLETGRVRGVRQYDDHVAAQIDGALVQARWLVDAAGIRGPTAQSVDRTDLCAAAQEERELDDVDAALAWLSARDLRPGEVASHSGVAGGFSIVNVCVRLPHDGKPGVVSLLTGSMPGLGHASGRVLIDRFVAENPWVGAVRFGGARAIPVGLPRVRFDDGRVARVGDSAGQVYAMHGSGIAPGMQAANLLARTLADGGTPWDYTVAWQRRYGPSMASSSVFQSFSRTLTPDAMTALIRAGLMHPELVRAGLRQQEPELRPRLMLALVASMVRAPRAAVRLAPVAGRMRKAQGLWAAFPSSQDELPAWAARRATMLG